MISTKQLGTVVMIFMALVGVAAQGSLHLPLGIPESWGPYIQSWALFILSIYSVANVFLPANVFGPLTPLPNEKVLTHDTMVVAPAGTTVTKSDSK